MVIMLAETYTIQRLYTPKPLPRMCFPAAAQWRELGNGSRTKTSFIFVFAVKLNTQSQTNDIIVDKVEGQIK